MPIPYAAHVVTSSDDLVQRGDEYVVCKLTLGDGQSVLLGDQAGDEEYATIVETAIRDETAIPALHA